MSKLDQVRRLREDGVALTRVAHPVAPKGKRPRLSPSSIITEQVDSADLKRRMAKTGLKLKAGRPRLEDADKTLAATKPWEAKRMSRTTWFRRQAEQRARAKQ